jgi:hypothetical protein
MQNESEEFDHIIDIYFSKAEAMSYFDKIQFHFDEVIKNSVEAIKGVHPEYHMVELISTYYNDKVQGMMEYCKDFINLLDDGDTIAVRRMINIFDTVQIDLVSMYQNDSNEFPEIELIDPTFEPSMKSIIFEIALSIIDSDIQNLSAKTEERIKDAIILELERRRMAEEGLL